MGLEAVYQKPRLSRKHPEHKIYPYLLRNLDITGPNQVWRSDITYVRMGKGFLYLQGLPLSHGHNGLVQPQGPVTGAVQYPGYEFFVQEP